MILNHKGKHRFAFANLRKLMNLQVAAAATMKSTRVGFLKGFERINSICRNYPIFLQKKGELLEHTLQGFLQFSSLCILVSFQKASAAIIRIAFLPPLFVNVYKDNRRKATIRPLFYLRISKC